MGLKQSGFFDYDERIEELKSKPTALDKLNSIIKWESFRPTLKKHVGYRNGSHGGRLPYDEVLMFKIIVLQKYYNLSEEDTEFQILDRYSFQRFLGLSVSDCVPDKNTIWRFKERLGEAGVEALFKQFSASLAKAGLKANAGKIIDASFVDVPRQQNRRDENQQIRSGGIPEDWHQNKAKLRQKDVHARWTTKAGERHYGYKNHIKVNKKSKVIEKYTVSDASVHDSRVVDQLVDSGDKALYADSAYSSWLMRHWLNTRGIRDEIHERAYSKKPLNENQKQDNRRKSKTRARVEHVFGFQCNNMSADRIRTIGIRRARQGIGLGNLIYNLFRFKQLGHAMF